MNFMHELELTTGMNVVTEIQKFVLEKKWKHALVMGALGSVRNVRVGNAAGNELPPTVNSIDIAGPFEILSFFGETELRTNNEVYVHIHASGSLSTGETLGGGLAAAEVFRGLKVYLTQLTK